jgi:hypothetical protein
MSRRFTSAMLVAFGVVLGLALGSNLRSDSWPPAARAADADDQQEREVIAQLKEINVQLKDTNTLLHSGKLRVINIIYPDAPQ